MLESVRFMRLSVCASVILQTLVFGPARVGAFQCPPFSPELLHAQALPGRSFFQHHLFAGWFASRQTVNAITFNPTIRNIDSPDEIGKVKVLSSSDQHLGEKFSDALRFLQMANAFVGASKILIVGDLLHKTASHLDHPAPLKTYKDMTPHEKILHWIRTMALSGRDVRRAGGNHDPQVNALADSGFAADGVQRFRKAIIETNGVRVLVLHGDEQDGIDRSDPHARASAPGARAYRLIQRWDHAQRRFTNALHLPPLFSLLRLWRFLYPPLRRYEKAFIRAVVAEAKTCGAQIVLTGHVHMARIQWVDDVLYINTGAWSELDPTVAVQSVDGVWELLRWRTGLPVPFKNQPPYPVGIRAKAVFEILWRRFTALALPPWEIAADPRSYRPGSLAYTSMKEHIEEHFRDYLAVANKNRVHALAQALNWFLRRAEDDLRDMTFREVEEIVYEYIHAVTEDWIPLREAKEIGHTAALPELPWIESQLSKTPRQRLKDALSWAVLGNRFGSSFFMKYAREGADALGVFLNHQRQVPLVWGKDHRDRLLDDLDGGPRDVMIILDNHVEVIYDLPAVQTLLEQGHRVTLVTKAKEAHNDVTLGDMLMLLKSPRVSERLGSYYDKGRLRAISSGSASRGTDLRRATLEFIQAWKAADVILALGEGTRSTFLGPNGASVVTKGFYSLAIAKESAETDIPLGSGTVEWIPPASRQDSHQTREQQAAS